MFVIGMLSLLLPAGAGGWLAWENRDTVVRIHLGTLEWTGHLYAVLVVGALMACWFILGAAIIQCRIAERRRGRAGAAAPLTPGSQPPPPPRRPRTPAQRSPATRAAAAAAARRVASPG